MYMQAQEAGEPAARPTTLTDRDLIFEFMLNALRLNEGFDEVTFVGRTGLSTHRLMDATRRAREKGLIERGATGIWKPTELGGRFLNDLQLEFIESGASTGTHQ